VLFGGLLGLATDDTQDRQSIEMAKEYGMEFDFEFEDHCDF
jgi:L-serine dehydratase